jgi:hypothetical protein
MPIDACCWAAAELALALGLITSGQADAIGSGSGEIERSAPGSTPSPWQPRQGPPVSPGCAGDDPASRPPVSPGCAGDDPASRPPVSPGCAGDDPASRPPVVSQPASDHGHHEAAPGQPPGGAPSGWRPADGREPADPAGVPDWLPLADGDGQPGQRPAGQRAPVVPHDPVSQAVRKAVRPGLLAFNPPAEMVQGRSERVEVGIARSPELRAALATGLRGRGALQFAGVDTSAFMGVELKGSSFDIIAFSPPEQLIAPLARWEFDVTPVRAGLQTLTLCVNLRIDSPVTPGGRIAVPVLERDILIRVDVGYGTRRFVTNNWQWLIATALGLGGALAAWIALIH